VPSYLSGWSLSTADRLLLATLVGLQSLGIYSLAANVGTIALVVVQAVNQAVLPAYGRLARTGQSGDFRGENLRRIVRTHMIAVVIPCCLLAALAPEIVRLTVAPQFRASADLVPIVVFGYALYGLYFIASNYVTIIRGKLAKAWPISLSAAAGSLVLMSSLVPPGGLTTAAWCSTAGYFLLLVGMSLYAIWLARS
jgi:O-antigen/teichoic acid export membrane protein